MPKPYPVAHSIMLAGASLGFLSVPIAPVEACIALSIVFVAAEIVHNRNGQPGITARRPWIAAFAFGLLHGFGLPSALHEIGLDAARGGAQHRQQGQNRFANRRKSAPWTPR